MPFPDCPSGSCTKNTDCSRCFKEEWDRKKQDAEEAFEKGLQEELRRDEERRKEEEEKRRKRRGRRTKKRRRRKVRRLNWKYRVIMG
jgi:hypothetical protein